MPIAIGLDIAKRVFQLHVINSDTGESERVKLRRSEMATHFANRLPCLVAMEACGSSQVVSRVFRTFVGGSLI